MQRAEVDVWLLSRPTSLPSLAWLDDVERARAAALPPRQAAGFVAGRRLLRSVLGERLGVPPGEVRLVARCPRCGGPHGQVRVEPPAQAPVPCHISVSRSGPSIAVATAHVPVGVDVESVDAVAAAPLADVALSVSERRRHDRLPAAARPGHLARTWARKEAVLKAFGTGLAVEPSSLTLTGAGTAVAATGAPRPRATVEDLPPEAFAPPGARRGAAAPEVVGAVAVLGGAHPVVRTHQGQGVLARA